MLTGSPTESLHRTKALFKSYKFDLANDLHERLVKPAGETGMTKNAINDALNYAVRSVSLNWNVKQGKIGVRVTGCCFALNVLKVSSALSCCRSFQVTV
jgi:hypothetical protein